MKLRCEICKARFEARRTRQCCNRSCSAKLASRTKGHPAWGDSEIDQLHGLAGKYTANEIVRRLNNFQKRNGLPVRTTAAIITKLKRLGHRTRPHLNNFPRDELARLLGIDRDRARSWCRTFGLTLEKGPQLMIVNLTKFKAWAYENPKCLAGIDADRLDWVMEDPEFSRRVSQMQRPRSGRKTPVVRLSDNKTFGSVREAARASYVTPSCIRRAIQQGGKSALSQWAYKNPEDGIAPAKYSDVS